MYADGDSCTRKNDKDEIEIKAKRSIQRELP